MKDTFSGFDVAVIGGGHAGVEAAMAAARLGVRTILFTLTLDGIANLPCNPSIGGTAKGHLVREIDALGGVMGIAADANTIQSRMLNLGKGPAVHSLRAQIDRQAYHTYVKRMLERQPNLSVRQAEITAVEAENGRVSAVRTRLGVRYPVRAVVIATGTYLNGEIHVGEVSYPGGPDGVAPAVGLRDSLEQLGIPLRRFKTGTPSRVHRRSIDFSQLEEQRGDEPPVPFSFAAKEPPQNLVCCHIAYTNPDAHRVILDNLDRSPIYSGRIHAIGPRYCPSIEDKLVRFADKPRHQCFVEPMGLDTDEMYLQGLSSSLPEDVQIAFLRKIRGFEHIEIMRNAYAIEYDCCDPLDLRPTLEFKRVAGLFGAGQFNGTSGYEEAAAQGLVAGINAAHQILGREPFTLARSTSYIGTLIDDLVTKGCSEPYRMMTSRSEFRLLLRQDNADLRLTPTGHALGLISEERYQAFCKKKREIDEEISWLELMTIPLSAELNEMLVSRGTTPVSTGVKFADLLRRPQLSYADIFPFSPCQAAPQDPAVIEQVEIQIKYEGYIQKQLAEARELYRLESRKIPRGLPYARIDGLRLEAREKLARIQPENVGQASRISGVNPADISALLIWLAAREERKENDHD